MPCAILALVATNPLWESAIEIARGGTFFVGRAEGCGMRVLDRRVSRFHAVLRREGARFWIEDCASRNGTYVGTRRLVPGVPVEIGVDEVVRIGDTELVVVELAKDRRAMALLEHPRFAAPVDTSGSFAWTQIRAVAARGDR